MNVFIDDEKSTINVIWNLIAHFLFISIIKEFYAKICFPFFCSLANPMPANNISSIVVLLLFGRTSSLLLKDSIQSLDNLCHTRYVHLLLLSVYSLECRNEKYLIINISDLISDSIVYYVSEREDVNRYWITILNLGCLDLLQFNSFRYKASHLFNFLQKFRDTALCSVVL